MKKKLNHYIYYFFISIFSIFLLTGCMTESKESSPSGVAAIDTVENIYFEIPLTVSTKATAVTHISDTENYARNNIYSYKDGNSTYLLFCMDELIIMASKGTTFSFSEASDKATCLENNSLLNTWFSISGKNFTYEEAKKNDYYKIISNVTAEVVITSELYGDYSGKLATIESGDEEWSLFVGVVAPSTGAMSKEQAAMVNQIVNSMQLYEKSTETEAAFDITINQSLKEVETSTLNENVEEKDIIPTVSIDVTEKKGLNISNQSQKTIDSSKAYTSDEYSMLKPGQAGIFTCINMPTEEQMIIRVNRVYTGEAAQELINQYANSQGRFGEIIAPQDGYTWHLVEYDLSYENCSNTPYVDIKLRGLDGGTLIFKGISIEQRTYDAYQDTIREGNCSYKNYCYYAVPNGCHNYSLECGDGTITDKNYISAYYYIEA